MQTATYNVGSARSIEQAYERDLRSIHALNHGLAGFINGVRATGADNADELIGRERRFIVDRQITIQNRLDDYFYDLSDIDADRARRLPPKPLNAAQIAAQRKAEAEKARRSTGKDA
jgi:hypothetical protein